VEVICKRLRENA
jgi:hypothetical protein